MNSTNQLSTLTLPADWSPLVRWNTRSTMRPFEGTKPTPRQHIDLLVSGIRPRRIRKIVGLVFKDLLRLLECLELIDRHLRKAEQAGETFVLFKLIHDEARLLVDFIAAQAPAIAGMQTLSETLDGITFAVEHDLQRVFESNPDGPMTGEPANIVVGKLVRSHDVLTNCLQQSAITLAMVFDPSLVGPKLFNNSASRRRESLQLCADLELLIGDLAQAEENIDHAFTVAVLKHVARFQSDSMQFLMYTDWPEFERFAERLKAGSHSNEDWQALTHQFRCYLETLLGQVKMRVILVPTNVEEDACEPVGATSPTSFLNCRVPSEFDKLKASLGSLTGQFDRFEMAV